MTADNIGLLPGFGWMADHTFCTTLLLCLALTPVGHILIGLIGESRLVPLNPWKMKQFWSFFPGDILLGIMAAGLLVHAQKLPSTDRWYNSTWWHTIVLIGACAVAISLTRGEYTSGGYPHRAILSPTKLYHNGVLYIGYGYVIVTTLVAVTASSTTRDVSLFYILIPGLFWVALVVRDNFEPPERSKMRASHAHVANWKPFWA